MPHESAEDFAELAAAFHRRYPPVDPAERLLIETLVRNEMAPPRSKNYFLRARASRPFWSGLEKHPALHYAIPI
jgi:hypothetical protein